MSQSADIFIVEASAMPEIFRKVAEAKVWLETGRRPQNGAAWRRDQPQRLYK